MAWPILRQMLSVGASAAHPTGKDKDVNHQGHEEHQEKIIAMNTQKMVRWRRTLHLTLSPYMSYAAFILRPMRVRAIASIAEEGSEKTALTGQVRPNYHTLQTLCPKDSNPSIQETDYKL